MKNKTAEILFILLALICLHPVVSSAAGLLMGVGFALLLENPFPKESRIWSSRLLQISVIGLGGVMDFRVVARVGLEGFGYTAVGISLTLVLGYLLGRALRVSRDATTLIGSGTAICGGSAIAAVAPVIHASAEDISVSLIIVFLLNALALLIFPAVGHHYHLTQHQFGLWAALAIHDTSSVVGASMQYGAQALEIATTIKLARALWIVPVAAAFAFFSAKGTSLKKIKKPWFILGFLALAALVTWVPATKPAGEMIAFAARRLLVVTLFLIGSSLSRRALRTVGAKPFVLGVLLWVSVASVTLIAILEHWI